MKYNHDHARVGKCSLCKDDRVSLDIDAGEDINRETSMENTAQAIVNSIQVRESFFLPDGHRMVTLGCNDYSVYKQLPAAVKFQGLVYGLTGWNSDSNEAYYKTSKAFALAMGV